MELGSLIEQLGIPHRAKSTYQTLLSLGFAIVPSVRLGLLHNNSDVRYYCVRLLDHLLTPDALIDLLSLLEDSDARVRMMVLHALACDRCKEGSCRPSGSEVLPCALERLCEDSDYHVRAMAIEVVGLFAHTVPNAAFALQEAHTKDTHPMVRKKAGWYAPGGSIYNRRLAKIR
jgi:HEAT repeat protein